MSNRARRERAAVRAAQPHISRDEQLRTVLLYRQLGNSNRVGEELGITGSAVRDRLYAIGCPLRPHGYSTRSAMWENAITNVIDKLRRGVMPSGSHPDRATRPGR